MNRLYEMILEKLFEVQAAYVKKYGENAHNFEALVVTRCISAVEEAKEECNEGWILVEEKLPDVDGYILLSFENFSLPLVGRWEEDDGGGAFYIGDETETCAQQDMFVNAWQPLPEPYSSE